MFGQSLLSGAFGSAACTTDTDQLFATDVTATTTATYQLNGVTTSIPSNTYPGTASNITYAAGKFDNAAVFNGSSSLITIPLNTVNVGSAYTVSLWFNAVNVGVNTGIFTNQATSAISNQIAINLINSTTISVASIVNNGSNTVDAISTTVPTMSANNWYNLVVVADRSLSNKVKLYLSGVEASNYNFNAGAGSNALYSIAQVGRADGRFFNGKLDQFRFFNSSLPQSAVTVLSNETVATSSSADVNYVDANPNSIAYYKMSDATDQLGNYNGTATNVDFNTEGKFGFAGAFNGTTSRINTGYYQNGQIYSVSFWAKNLNGDSVFRDTPSSGGGDTRMDVTVTATKGVGLGANVALVPSFTPNSTIWNHYVVSLDGSTAKIYANGVEVGSKSYTPRTGYAGSGSAVNPVCMMSNGLYPAGFGSGNLDQIRIYDSAISAANVTTLYNEIECPAATIINSFNPVIYTGTGGTQSISTVGFAPDFVWIKQRTAPNRDHVLHDIIRGSNKVLYANLSNSQDTLNASYFTSFDSNGFTLGGDSYYNGSSLDYVAWSWKGGGTAVSNTDGTIASSVSANQAAGFSIASYTSTGTNGSTFGHGLNAIPELVLLKCTSTNSTNWIVGGSILGNDYYLSLNSAAARQSSSNWLVPSAKTLQLNQTFGNANSSGREYITYNFTSIPGYSRVGYYIGNGSPTGPIIYTGFKPRFIMTKPSSIGDNWSIWGVNQSGNDIDQILVANNNASQSAVGFGRYNITLSSTGFQLKRSDSQINQNGATYIFLAIA